ncbi:nucleotidyltransferase substrate binding protein%2C HI0074 family [uncultured Bacteroides sp.]|uniref:toxin-antitoxin system antitoxin subunit n=1 Tax=Bacteroides cellulolyticus TaxID=2981780 RepID=UPI000821554F|nr:toxin-antitoxin system antitoxin subunit [Bacteroides cellulolyticus]MCU6770361.1 toxin-antitoxin system antitoxin subunit [Bacteroides cellulolyticus]SCH07142.1 nucleotidyltransferase substrate binding protein%2C HI0074 family [uncultured Bacteroides sp.]
MTEREKEIRERITREFEVCDRHIIRIKEALDELSAILPIQCDKYQTLTSDEVRCLDQFIFRFSKLQDAMGAKLFRYILEHLNEDISSLPMRDILNRLERYNIIPSVSEWIYVRELRNEITHDYPIDDQEVVQAINELINKTDILLEIYKELKKRFYSEEYTGY